MNTFGINEINLNSDLEKISMYKIEEDLNFEAITKSLENFNLYYNTNNKDKISNINMEISSKLKTISNIHNNYKIIVNKTVNKYNDTEKKVLDSLSNIIIKGDING